MLPLLLSALMLATPSPATVAWPDAGATLVAALDGGSLHQARYAAGTWTETGSTPAPGISALVRLAGRLLGARDHDLVDLATGATVATLPHPIRQLLPCPDPPGLVLLTGEPADPAPREAAVYLLGADGTPRPITAIDPAWRTWRLGWARAGDALRLFACTYKRTRYAPFEHNCHFLFDWHAGAPQAWWLGSRLSQPYRDATHADLRGDGYDRLIAVEETRDGGTQLAVYDPIGFGYLEGWRSPPLPGLARVVTLGARIYAWGTGAEGPWLKRLAWQQPGYLLADETPAPPEPDSLVDLDGRVAGGYWSGAWHTTGSGPA